MTRPTPPARPPIDDATRVAFHEAGHAVMAELLGRRVRYVSVAPDGDSRGTCRLADGPAWFEDDRERGATRRQRRWVRREVVIAAAGGLAERMVTGRRPLARLDRRRCADLLAMLYFLDQDMQ